MACTSRIEARRWRRTIRIRAVAAVPRPPPYTRYTTCRLSTTTMGSATPVPRLCPPEVEESDNERNERPASPQPPQARLAHDGMAVLAEGHVLVPIGEARVQRA